MSSQEAINLLTAETERFGMRFSPQTLEGFRHYLDLLASYNTKVNLVADAEPTVVVRRHVLDCLAVAEIINGTSALTQETRKLVDIGTGAGLPGLIIALACPDLEVILLDSIGKKTRFLEEAVRALSIADRVTVITGRAEELARTKRRTSFDLATSRAVGHLGMVVELALPLLKIGGRLLCQKSRKQVDVEIDELDNFLQPMGGQRAEILVPSIQISESEHVVVSIEKRHGTQDRYPRSWSEIIRQWKN